MINIHSHTHLSLSTKHSSGDNCDYDSFSEPEREVLCLLAGQIGLVPGTMVLVSGGLDAQLTLAFRYVCVYVCVYVWYMNMQF
jgi:hypothetical protein